MTRDEFHLLTRDFIGLEISRPWLGHGSAFYAEVGPLCLSYPRTNNTKAERSIDFGCSWRAETQRSIAFGIFSSEGAIQRGIKSLQGQTIEELSIVGRLPELQIRLSSGMWVSTFAVWETQPDWAVFLPDKTWLAVKRGAIVRESSENFSPDHSNT